MVERPIKKSARQTESVPSEGGLDETNQSHQEPNTTKRLKGKGKTRQQKSSEPRSVNPALMRGPKPTKPKPPVVKETVEATESDALTEVGQEDTITEVGQETGTQE
jgi:hypothetical protein